MKTLNMLTWFDKATEFLVGELEIKNISEKEFKELLQTDELYACIPLSLKQLQYIRAKNDFPLELGKYEYFMEFVGDYVLDLQDCTWIPATDETRKPSVEPVKTHQDKKEKK